MREFAMYSVSAGARRSRPLNFNSTSWPLTSTWGARPGEKIRSLTWPWDFSMARISWGTGKERGAGGAGGVSGGVSVELMVPLGGLWAEKWRDWRGSRSRRLLDSSLRGRGKSKGKLRYRYFWMV